MAVVGVRASGAGCGARDVLAAAGVRARVATAPGCHFFQGAGQVGGALLGGTTEGLRQSSTWRHHGRSRGGGGRRLAGGLVGAAAGLPEGGVGALPGLG